MPLMVRVPVPVLVSVTGCGALLAPTGCTPKLKLGTEKPTTAASPVPVNATD